MSRPFNPYLPPSFTPGNTWLGTGAHKAMEPITHVDRFFVALPDTASPSYDSGANNPGSYPRSFDCSGLLAPPDSAMATGSFFAVCRVFG